MNKKTIYAIVFLVGGYILAQAVADVGATKLIEVKGVVMPAGTIMFALTFTLRDLLHKRLGRDWARAAIIAAGVFNVIQAGYLAWMARVPSPVFFGLGEAWAAVFSVVPAITAGSIIAELISELIDTEVYHLVKKKAEKLPQWTRVLISNGISAPIDSFIFAALAFTILPPIFGGEALPLAAAFGITSGQIIFKYIVTAVSMPTIYLVKDESII